MRSPIYILMLRGKPHTGGDKKYHIRQAYADLSESDKSATTPYVCSRTNGYHFVERSIEWLLEE